MDNIIGRTTEIAELNELYNRTTAELVAIYGRRRVGKTFLINEVLEDRMTFKHAGMSPIDGKSRNLLKEQLSSFYFSLKKYGSDVKKCPTSWLEAFFYLEMLLQKKDDGSRQVVFLDELPWLDTPRSGFISAFEAFWNGWACSRNIMVVVCGSANSWILDELINNYGGLYGRVTYEIKLEPFSLKECEEFFQKKGIQLSRYDIVQSYMIIGGIPYYLNYFNKGKSLSQNIDSLFFSRTAKLKDEFNRLFDSAFKSPEDIKKIVMLLGERHSGYTRKEIASKTGIEGSGNLSKMLKALVASDFVIKYVPFGMGLRDTRYKLTDPFCLFYLKFVMGRKSLSNDFWTTNVDSQSVVSWRGIAFEDVCLYHIKEIKAALGIAGVSSNQSSWIARGRDEKEGLQIDLLINRKDNVVNMCEMKFYSEDFAVDKNYYRVLLSRVNALREHLPKKAIVHSTLVTTFGLKYNEYFGIFQKVVTMDDLFK